MKLELLNEEERIRIRNVIQSLLACNFLTREHDAALYIAALPRRACGVFSGDRLGVPCGRAL